MALNFMGLQQPLPPQGLPGGGPIVAPPMPQIPGMPPMQQAGPQGMIGQLLAKLQDPNVRQAITATGLNLMKTPEFGKNGFDTAATALQTGMSTLDALRQRQRSQGIESEDRTNKQTQQGVENKRADKQVEIQQQNADTSRENVRGDAAAKQQDQVRADKALEEAIRHNKSQEEIDRLRAAADRIRANAYFGSTSRTPAEVEKMNRLRAFYKKQNPNLSDEEADKQALDYLSTAKGKSPRQLVMDAMQRKFAAWADTQMDPDAQPTPDMRNMWKNQAIEEVKFAEEAGASVTNQRGTINRPGSAPGASPPASGATASPGAQPPAAPAQKQPATERSIEKWKVMKATPEQIKLAIAAGGEDPSIYGY
jgi:hypothetical protein